MFSFQIVGYMVMSIIATLFAFGQLIWESMAAGVTKCHEVEYDWNYDNDNRCDEVMSKYVYVQIYEKKQRYRFVSASSFMTSWCVVDYKIFKVTPETRYYSWLD